MRWIFKIRIRLLCQIADEKITFHPFLFLLTEWSTDISNYRAVFTLLLNNRSARSVRKGDHETFATPKWKLPSFLKLFYNPCGSSVRLSIKNWFWHVRIVLTLHNDKWKQSNSIKLYKTNWSILPSKTCWFYDNLKSFFCMKQFIIKWIIE